MKKEFSFRFVTRNFNSSDNDFASSSNAIKNIPDLNKYRMSGLSLFNSKYLEYNLLKVNQSPFIVEVNYL